MKRLLCGLALAATLSPVLADEMPAVRTAPQGQAKTVGAEAQLIKLTQLRSSNHGNRIGTRRSGMFCGVDGEVRFDAAAARLFTVLAGSALRKEMDAAGYPKPPNSAFEQQAGDAQVEYQLGLTLVDMQLETCLRGTELSGGVWLKADIELFSPRERRVVFRASYEGHRQTAAGQQEKASAFYEAAAQTLARNVLADPAFVEHATRKAQPAAAGAAAGAQTALAVVRRHGGGGQAQQLMPLLQSAVATVFSGAGSGSAWLLAADGHWLTNRHVVGDAKYVKLKLANGRELLGEVLRSDARRDVALLKSEAVALSAFEVAEQEPTTGTEVYAIGSPLGEKLEGTVTRGIVSSLREFEQRRYLQSDVKVLPGSSGGPLVDGRGALVGMTAGGIGGIATGMNLFIPVREAMSALQLEFGKP